LSLDWYPPNIFLLRRSATDLLAAEHAWWPGRPVATDIEYFALAALLGLRFVHVPEALVAYNLWSRQQIAASTSYPQQALVLNDISRGSARWRSVGRAVPPAAGHRNCWS
jgi:hypothetical protein